MDVRPVEMENDKITTPHCAINNTVTSFVNCQTASKIDLFAQEITSAAFWYVFTAYIVFSMAVGVVLTFTDTMCYQLLGRDVEK